MARYASEGFTCVVTGCPGADAHHLITRKSGGSDEPWNLIYLSHALHQEVHSIGMMRFAQKYPAVRDWLIRNDWRIDPLLLKWKHQGGPI